jgi:hypothetical protein
MRRTRSSSTGADPAGHPLVRAASYDQYANLVLDGAVERIVVDGCYADVPFGIFVVRGENVMLLGETDAEKETQLGERLTNVTEAEIRRALAAQKEDSDSFNRGDKFEWPILEEFWYVRARTALAAALGATAERRTDDHLASVPRTADSAHRDLSTESARAVPCGAVRGGADEQATAPSGCQCKQCTPTVCAG